jgi:hypothetical protein
MYIFSFIFLHNRICIIHNDNLVLLYHVLFGKPFDIVDMMLREIQKLRTDNRVRMPYAPYIMLLIQRATEGQIVPESGGNVYKKHPGYNVLEMEPKQPQNKRASKSKKSMRVPPVFKQLQQHAVHRILEMEPKQPQNKKASKSKKSMRVPPVFRQVQHGSQ